MKVTNDIEKAAKLPMDNMTIHNGVVANGKMQQDEPIGQPHNALPALIEDAYGIADDMVGLAYERDLINAELVQKRKQLRQLCTAMKREYSATQSRLLAMEESIRN